MQSLVPAPRPGGRGSRHAAASIAAPLAAFARATASAVVPIAALLLAALTPPASAQGEGPAAGGIIGKVFSASTGDPIAFANINCVRAGAAPGGPPAGSTVALGDGTYRIETEPGTYRVEAVSIGYSRFTVTAVEVAPGRFTVLDLPLSVEALQVETVEVTASTIRNTEAALLVKQKNAPAVSDGISADQIAKTTDSNAAEAVSRVTGISVVGGRYVYVRGLGERYSSTTVNGTKIGSPEPNRRVVPLDLFPAGLLQNMVVQKTYTPDMPAEFGGGVVDIQTKNFPRDRTWSLSVSGGDRNNVAGKDIGTYPGGDADYWGFADAKRDLPPLIEATAPTERIFLNNSIFNTGGGFKGEQHAELGRSFANIWNPTTETARPRHGYSGSYGDEISVLGRPLGFLGSFTLSNSRNTTAFFNSLATQTSFNPDTGDSILSRAYEYEGENAKIETLWGGLLSTGLRIADGHTVKIDGLYTRSAEDELIRYEGENFDRGRSIKVTRLKYVERGILVASGGMEHVLPVMGGMKLNWKTSYTRSERNEPDRREYVYELFERMDSTGAEYEVYELSRRDKNQDLTRYWQYLGEDDRAQTADLEIPFLSWNGLEARARAGVLFENRDRHSRVRRFTYDAPGAQASGLDFSLSPEELLTPENIGAGTSRNFVLDEITKPTDSYTARHDLNAQYLMVDLPLHRRARLVTGARVERSDLIVTTKDPFAVPDSNGVLPDSAVVAEARLEEQDVLPSANLTYQLTRDVNLRAALSRTLNRPDFRELSRSTYTNFISGGEEIGNASLKVAKLANYDVRAELYLGPSELLAVSGFYKVIDRPIDRVRVIGNAGNTAYTYQNAKDGFLFGTELEARLRLGRLTRFLDAFSVNTNLTLVESEQEFVEAGRERTSPLLRQAPYVANVVLTFETLDGKTTASALYNVFGRRRSSVGLQETPDEYEEPRHSVDVTVGRRIGPVRVKLAAENLLNEDEVYSADKPGLREKFIADRQETGRGFSLGISYGS